MATTQKTKVADLESHVLLPEPTAAPPDILARQQNVDWLIGRETCGFYTKSADDNDTIWEAFNCPIGTCTISSSYIGCDYRFNTACSDSFGTDCPSSRARKRQNLPAAENVLCCTQTNLNCMTAIMTLGEGEFLTGFKCRTDVEGEVMLHPSTPDGSEPTDTSTGESSTTTEPDVISDPTAPPTISTDPEPRTRRGGVNVGAIAGGVIGGVGVLVIVICCVLYFRRRRKEERAGRGVKPKPVFAVTDYPHPPHPNTYEKPDEQLPRVATEMPPFSTVGSNTVAELPDKQ